ncbi:hypothetical protein DMH25_08370 [Streptomyces sp. WAC 01325]|uniref:hypothetical protein n=1 Tax=Streptomyces sp. WAC 01325 TaxID=2203202 RepID=UPI000F86C6BC|nr:hypothetical protein [Streptomyces sp. WAC 01325]RSN13792.1 hypothetical protein DMH25_08370 [Streptomyces sp. WAC 01325]
MSYSTHLDVALSRYCRRSGDPLGEPTRLLAQFTHALRAEILAADGQAYAGELTVLRGLVATLTAVAQHGDLSDVQKLLRDHTRTDAEVRQGGAVPPLTVYRAEHPDSGVTLGHYGTREAARKHCETVLRREVGDEVFLGWVPDDGSELAAEELCIGHDFECSGYIVVPLEVPSEYDAEADE